MTRIRSRINSGPETDVSFHEGDEGREVKDGVARKMVKLEFVEIKEAPEEVRRRKAETVLKMGGKHHHFAWIGHRLTLITRNPTRYLFRYSPRPAQPIYLRLAHIRAPPGASRISRRVWAAILIQPAGFFLQPVNFFFQRVGFLIHGILLTQRYLGLLANLRATGKI
jgi:hypothetical protein